MVSQGILTQSSCSPWGFPICLVVKKDGDVRVTADLRLLNNVTVPDNFNLSNILDFSVKLYNTRVFSRLDISNAFYRIPTSLRTSKIFTLNTVFGSFRLNYLAQGFRDSSSVFTRVMQIIFADLKEVTYFIDDILIATEDHERHREVLKEVFKRLRYFELKLTSNKCQIAKDKLDFLGFNISRKGFRPSDERVKAIRNARLPTTVKDVRAYIGALNFTRNTIPHLSKMLKPLLKHLKGSPHGRRKITIDQETILAFEETKGAMMKAVTLSFPSEDDEILFFSDASEEALSAVVYARRKNQNLPLGFFSYILKDVEKAYSIFSKELLSVKLGIAKFAYLLHGRRFKLYNDNKAVIANLVSNKERKTLLKRELRYLSSISEFSFDYDMPAAQKNKNEIETYPLSVITNAEYLYRKLQSKDKWFDRKNSGTKTMYAYELM